MPSVFRKMLDSGHPRDHWSQLVAAARTAGQRLQRFAAGAAPQGFLFAVKGAVLRKDYRHRLPARLRAM